ncbi:hypothetical protein V2G26_020715 [Clonostachys chloroleuca]|uniref:Uncharacterized protein n=1 Tax=Clonostachys chloroleuca TaxID=1926264 RepID=A0AA35LWD8_9HYPO|nr:unnamed protein product [Clonostachys chloroleuca]
MGYVLYSICFSFILFVTAVVVTRSYWLPLLEDIHLPGADYLYSRLPTSFADDIEAGLSSSNFDLNANVEAGDSRQGLDTAAKAEITKIMKKRRMTFDQARKVYMENRFKANGIGPDGLPRDPKFVSFS